ncbi:hypothetical protein FOG51_01019 [Hanseniaspora uvarum]|jgi:hypothetical protein|nr:hypothetical protein FOG51_01019 [Hanseniaspora uvarum]GMM40618.1 hypothetical protein DAHU10_015190 [Hanseniaspora uvarum]
MTKQANFKNEDIALKYLNIKTDKFNYEQNLSLERNPVRRGIKGGNQLLRKVGWLYIGHFPCQLLPMFDSGCVYLAFNLIFVFVVYAAVKYAINLVSLFI